MADVAGGRSRRRLRWAAPVLTFLATLSLAALAVATNLATAVVPDSLPWLKNGAILWFAVVILALLSAVLTTWAGRRTDVSDSTSDGLSISVGAGSVVSGTSAAVGTVSTGAGSVVIVAPQGPVTVPVPQPQPSSRPGQLVLGAIPGEPPSFQRRQELADLDRLFVVGGRVAVVCALTGTRGVGKTQLAAAYARQQAAAGCPLVAWVSAETLDVLVGELAEVARAVGVADPDDDSIKSALRLRDHFQTRQNPALLVIDNATDADQVRRFVPGTGCTAVIVTSTDHALARLGTAVDLSVFKRQQSLTYLHARTGLDDHENADRVAEELGDLPLALAQAASVIALHRISYLDYLARLRRMPVADVLTRRCGDPYPKGAAEAILLSVRAIEDTDQSGLITRVLAAVAVLSPTGTHRTVLSQILKAGNADAAPPVASVWRSACLVSARTTRLTATGVVSIDEALACLVGLSLLGWGQSGTSVILHRLVGRIVRDRLQAAGCLAATILDAVAALQSLLIPDDQAWGHRKQGTELVSHAVAVWDIALNHAGDDRLTTGQVTHCADLANWAVRHLTVTADLSRAIRIGAQVLGDCERVLGSDHPKTLTSRTNLAYAYELAGRLVEAIRMYEEILTDYERLRGADHEKTVTARNNLALAYKSAGRLAEAIPLFEATLSGYQRILDADHPHNLTARNNLAEAYQSAGRLTQAISLFEATLTDCVRTLGADHPNTQTARNNLAKTYESAGRLVDAIPLYETALTERQRQQGFDHPDTLISRANLAYAYESAGRLPEAIELFEATLTDCERVLGLDHPTTLTSRSHLAGAYESAGRLAEAIPLYETTLPDHERVLGTDHPATLTLRNDLAYTYQAAGRLAEAIPLFKTAFTGRERVLGPDHPHTLTSRTNLAYAYLSAGRLEQAIPLFEATLTDVERMLGPGHPTTRSVRDILQQERNE